MTSTCSLRWACCSSLWLALACSDTAETAPLPEPRVCHLPKDDRRIVDIEAFPWDEWFALRADGTIVQFSRYGFQEWEEAAAGDEPCMTSLQADRDLGGTSYRGSATMVDYAQSEYVGLEFPFTFDLPGARSAVAVLGTYNLAVLDDESQVWVYWQDRQPDGRTGQQRLEPVSLPGPVIQLAGDAGMCFLQSDGDVYCLDTGQTDAEPKYGLGDVPPPKGVFQLPVSDAKFLSMGTAHLCVITNNDDTMCAGRGGSGELGVPREELPPSLTRSSFEPARGVPEFERVWLRYGSTCGATSAGELWCYGRNIEEPSMTEDTMPPTLVGTFPGYLDVALSDTSTCVLRADHRVVCKGALPEYLSCAQEDGWDVMAIDGCSPPGSEP